MGILDLFRPLRRLQSATGQQHYETFAPYTLTVNGTEVDGPGELAAARFMEMSPAQMWRTQPHLRTVVSFLARNIAQLGLHVFERVNESDRQRDRTSPLALTLLRPNATTTAYELVYSLVVDLALYDWAGWLVARDADAPSGWTLTRIPPAWVTPRAATAFTVGEYVVQRPGQEQPVVIPASDMWTIHGYSPTDPRSGSPTVQALKQTLWESQQATEYRRQVWERGGRTSSVLQRPKEAPAWSAEARERFREDWKAKYTGNGPGAGGTPILEDGMTLNRVDFSAHEQEWVEGIKLSLATVAAGYHINPTMVGLLDNANYSNVREFRRMLYGDTLGPEIARIEDRVNAFLLPMLGMDPARYYAEFNIGEKLQGSFEEQNAALQTAIGRPWMTPDEGRARLNMPAIGGDAAQLATPLNVLTGGQASPTDSGSQNRSSGPAPQVKARAPETFEQKHQQVLADFFRRQERVVRGQLGLKDASDWWSAERWDRELTTDLLALSVETSREVGPATCERLGIQPEDYDVDRTIAFLTAVAERVASGVNETTRQQIEDALGEDDKTAAVAGVFEVAATARAAQMATTLVTSTSGFATTEAARQAPGRAVKTWVTGANPRPSHARMDGETVAVDQPFSNGLQWPGSGTNTDETAGCNCRVQVSVESDE